MQLFLWRVYERKENRDVARLTRKLQVAEAAKPAVNEFHGDVLRKIGLWWAWDWNIGKAEQLEH